jgi:hypothetical protein
MNNLTGAVHGYASNDTRETNLQPIARLYSGLRARLAGKWANRSGMNASM